MFARKIFFSGIFWRGGGNAISYAFGWAPGLPPAKSGPVCSCLGHAAISAYVVTASDLRAIHAGNNIFKFADDRSSQQHRYQSRRAKSLAHLQAWSSHKLQLNCNKSHEMKSYFSRRKGSCCNLCRRRVNSLSALGVVINDGLTAADHVTTTLSPCSTMMYALRALRDHDICHPALYITSTVLATVLAKILYCSLACACLHHTSLRRPLPAMPRLEQHYVRRLVIDYIE